MPVTMVCGIVPAHRAHSCTDGTAPPSGPNTVATAPRGNALPGVDDDLIHRHPPDDQVPFPSDLHPAPGPTSRGMPSAYPTPTTLRCVAVAVVCVPP